MEYDTPDGLSRPLYIAQAAAAYGVTEKHWRWLVSNDKGPAPDLYDWEGRPRWWLTTVRDWPYYPPRRPPRRARRDPAGVAGG